MSSLSPHTAHSERPERSRNAKAQARHRAKRKAYIEQLEQTVTKLQTQLNISPEQISVLPPPLVRIRELEDENARLLKENDDLRRMLQESSGGRALTHDLTRRALPHDSRNSGEREAKRRKPDSNDLYMPITEIRPPPPLTIPHPSQYGHPSSAHSGPPSGLYSMNSNGVPFQLPNTPSASSSSSSPRFSPQMHSHGHSPPNPRTSLPSLAPQHGNASHYSSVKVEDEPYSNQHSSAHYPPSPFTYSSHSQSEHGLDTWHSYSSERAVVR